MFNVVVGSFLGNLNVCVRGGHCDFFLFLFLFWYITFRDAFLAARISL